LVRERRGQVVGIVGDPGIGKSRTLLEFRRALAREGIAGMEARCVSYGRDWPLLPITELIRRANGGEEGDRPDVAAEKVHANLAALGLPADDLTSYLLRMIGIDDPTRVSTHLAPEMLRERMVDAFRRILLACSRVHPLVVVVEDVHWIDRASEGYLAALVDAMAESQVLVLTTHRPGYGAPWSEWSYVTELRLQPLTRADARGVLDGALQRGDAAGLVPAASADAILDRADGNPFFIEELAQAMASSTSGAAVVPASVGPVGERLRAAVCGRSWLCWSLESLGEFGAALAVGREAIEIARTHRAAGLEATRTR
jgi:predicted ATPase